MTKNKKMIYIRPENLEFYTALENKSEFVNDALELARLGGVESLRVGEVVSNPTERVGTEGVHDAVESMRERDLRLLKEYREKKGLSDPTEE